MLFSRVPASGSLTLAILRNAARSKRLPHALLTATLLGASLSQNAAAESASRRAQTPGGGAAAGGGGEEPLPTVRSLLAAVGVSLTTPNSTSGRSSYFPGGDSPPPPPSWEDMDVKELGMQVSLGSVAGFTSGYAVKKISKLAAVFVGLSFITIQVARYYGIVDNVDWKGLESKLVTALDADGDGRVTGSDLKAHFDKAVAILGFNLPSGAAFSTAFVLGLRYG